MSKKRLQQRQSLLNSKKTVDKIHALTNEVTEKEVPDLSLIVPYGRRAKEFRQGMQKTVKQHINKNLNVIFKTNTIANYFSNKCATPKQCRADVVYQFTCHGCTAVYYGETERHLHYRLLEHRQPSRTSKVLEHNLECNERQHLLELQEFKIIAGNFTSSRERKIREALEIRMRSNSINVQNFRQASDVIKLFK